MRPNQQPKINPNRIDRFTWKPGDVEIKFPNSEQRRKAYGITDANDVKSASNNVRIFDDSKPNHSPDITSK